MQFNQVAQQAHDMASGVRLSNIIDGIPVVQVFGPLDAYVTDISSDSRSVALRGIFAAVEGEHTDGHMYVQSAIERGAAAVVVQKQQYERSLHALLTASYAQHHCVTVLVVQDSRTALGLLADRFYGSPSKKLSMIGITGTNGKTTTSYLLHSILKQAGVNASLIGTIEYRIGKRTAPASFTTPLAEQLHGLLADAVKARSTALVMEVSSHALALRRVHGAMFDISVFTNLTQDHLDFHRTMDSYAAAKAMLFSEYTRGSALFNADDDAYARMAAGVKRKCAYGRQGRPRFKIVEAKTSLRGTSVTVKHDGGTITLQSSLVGMFNAYNMTAAYAGAILLGIDGSIAAEGIRKLKGVPGRFTKVASKLGVTGIVDYSHTPDSLAKAIENAKMLAGNGNVITVFGCGGDRDKGKRKLMGRIASTTSDFVIVTSDNPRSENPEEIIDQIFDGIRRNAPARRITSRVEAIRYAVAEARKGDIVLVAGKGHENYQLIGPLRMPFDDAQKLKDAFRDREDGRL